MLLSPSFEKLLVLTAAIEEAVGSDDWDTVNALLVERDPLITGASFSPYEQKQLQDLQNRIELAAYRAKGKVMDEVRLVQKAIHNTKHVSQSNAA